MRLIIHTEVGTFVKKNATKTDRHMLEHAMRSYRETFEVTCAQSQGAFTEPGEHNYVLPSADLYFSVEDEDS